MYGSCKRVYPFCARVTRSCQFRMKEAMGVVSQGLPHFVIATQGVTDFL